MAHIPNSNLLNSIAVNHAVSAPVATVSSLIKATAVINNELMMTLRDATTQRPLDLPNSKVSLSQAQLLQSQQLLIQSQVQFTQVFLASALKTISVSLPPSLMPLLEQYLKQNQLDKNTPLPKELIILLAKSLNSSEVKLNQKMVQISAKANTMLALMLVDDPIVEVTSHSKSSTASNPENVFNLLSLMIPMDDDEQSFIAINQRSSNASAPCSDSGILFEFTMNLNPLGVVNCAIVLNGFNLNIEAHCSNQDVKSRINQYWGLLEDRLTKLGFSTTSQFPITPQDSENAPSTRLIDIKI